VGVYSLGVQGASSSSNDKSLSPLASSPPSPVISLVSAALSQYSDFMKTRRSHALMNKAENGGTEENPETRGGGHGHGGGGGGGHGAITLDPVSIISLLALGAFLINNILQLLRANQAAPAPAPGRRSLDFNSMSVLSALATSLDGSRPDFYGGDGIGRGEDESDGAGGEPNFSKFFENMGSLYYLQPKKRNLCIKKVVCGYISAKKAREDSSTASWGQGQFKTSIFDFMLNTITRFVVPELTSHSPVKEEVCKKYGRLCSDSLLKDAKLSVKNKVYNEVTSLISTLTMRQLSMLG